MEKKLTKKDVRNNLSVEVYETYEPPPASPKKITQILLRSNDLLVHDNAESAKGVFS